mmetsp:Transcript_72520/g.151384  ORF Transcript_72520/g.151384 Transcript_72520/m.151384 type:complete len:383 (+) Transcript_72520:264-1412(+)
MQKIEIFELLEDPEQKRFLLLSAGFVGGIALSCYVEEWIFTMLPGFDFYWTVAAVELAMFSVGGLLQQRSSGENRAIRKGPLRLYAIAALCLTLSQGLGKVAFKYLDYTTGTIVKSGKLLPTMAINILVLHREVPPVKWCAAVLLVASAVFMALGERAVSFRFQPVGLVISAAQLFFAAFQGNLTENLLKDHGASVGEVMTYMNGLGLLCVLLVLIAKLEAVPAFLYFANSPEALILLALRSVLFYFGGLASTILTKEFGTNSATAVGTARKSLTVLASFVLFPKPFHINYAFGVVLFIAAEVVYVLAAKKAATTGAPPPKAALPAGKVSPAGSTATTVGKSSHTMSSGNHHEEDDEFDLEEGDALLSGGLEASTKTERCRD